VLDFTGFMRKSGGGTPGLSFLYVGLESFRLYWSGSVHLYNREI
jgi:hypothetical protein